VGRGRLDSLEFWTDESMADRHARCGAAWDSSGPCLHLRCLEHSALNLHLDQVTISRQFDVVFLEHCLFKSRVVDNTTTKWQQLPLLADNHPC
jgi:hypothetical protein